MLPLLVNMDMIPFHQVNSLDEIRQHFCAIQYSEDHITAHTRRIYDLLASRQQNSSSRDGNITPADLELMFAEYDPAFFHGQLAKLLGESGSSLQFGVSSRLTRSAGVTKRTKRAARKGGPVTETRFMIALSSTILNRDFGRIDREVRVNGLTCRNRIEAAQRVFEHELLHMLELLLWDRSSCRKPLFRRLARQMFGHTETQHELVTPVELAKKTLDLRVGSRVAFTFEGRRMTGIINRVTLRATVLVEDPKGSRYTDGKHYLKWYVPLESLEKLD